MLLLLVLYGHEIWLTLLQEEHRLREFKIRVLGIL